MEQIKDAFENEEYLEREAYMSKIRATFEAIENDFAFATVEQLRILELVLSGVQAGFDLTTEKNCAESLDKLGFEVKPKQ